MAFHFIFLLFAILTCELNPATFKPIDDLSQINSWSGYYKYLPVKTQTYVGKRAAVIFTHGAEDAEVLYPIAFFKDRGADITVACAPQEFVYQQNPTVLILDLVKPTFTYPCDISYEAINLLDYDIVYVSGGAASSYPVRGSTVLTAKLHQFAMEKDQNALIGFICSGSEVILESGFVPYMKSTTGSPTSKLVFQLNRVHVVDLPVTIGTFPKGAKLIVGSGPDASFDFFVKMTELLYGVTEEGHTEDFSPLVIGFTQVNDIKHLPPMWDVNYVPDPILKKDLGTKRIGVLVADGVDSSVTKALSEVSETNFYGLCPRGLLNVVSHRVATPQYIISCNALNEISDLTSNEADVLDALVVPGGWWHINNLRVESRAIRTVRNHIALGRPVIAIDGGLQILALADVIRGHSVAAHSAVKMDALAAGAVIDESDGYVVSKNIITVDTTKFVDDPNKIANMIMKDLVTMLNNPNDNAGEPECTCNCDMKEGSIDSILGLSITTLVLLAFVTVCIFVVVYKLRTMTSTNTPKYAALH